MATCSKVVLDRTIKKCDWAESLSSELEGLGRLQQ